MRQTTMTCDRCGKAFDGPQGDLGHWYTVTMTEIGSASGVMFSDPTPRPHDLCYSCHLIVRRAVADAIKEGREALGEASPHRDT